MMRCDVARRALSERLDSAPAVDGAHDLDGALDGVLETHLQSCNGCAEFERIALAARGVLRYGPDRVDEDLPAKVVALLKQRVADERVESRRRRRRWVAPVAVFLLCAVVAFTVTRGRGGLSPAAADARADLVARGQTVVQSFEAGVAIHERGVDGAVSVYASGSLTYAAPEAVVLGLTGPSGSVEVGVNGDVAWRVAGVGAAADEAGTVVRGREPFDAGGWSALELVVPVAAFGRDELGTEAAELDGRDARLVRTTVAQVDELLGALRTGGGWRPLHPADRVMLWLDADTAVPLRIEVHAHPGDDRVAWSARRGLLEPSTGPLFVAALSVMGVDGRSAAAVPPPVVAEGGDLGFVDRTVATTELPVPAALPPGMVEYRSGERRRAAHDPAVAMVVRTWTNGRSWLKVSGTHGWTGERLFGNLGALVRPVVTGAGVVYVSEDGSAVALHGDSIDIVVTGSVGERALLDVASSLGIDARPVPAWWREASSTTVDDLRAAGVAALVPQHNSTERSGAALSVALDRDRVLVSVAGPGARGARLVTSAGGVLPPPEDPDAGTVALRGTQARYSPALGELAWVERGHAHVMTSSTLSFADLRDLAEGLEWLGG